jgi:putative peptidoglycan lipid II flippase
MTEAPQNPPARSGAGLVAMGILLSRLVGFVRERVYAHYLGVGPHMDVLRMAFRIPNVVQNLLGEGTLSAAFIPIYARMVEEGRREEAGRFAGAIFGILLATAGGLSLAGMLLARPIVAVLSPGFLHGAGAVDRFELSVTATRIIFPMTGFLVLSVWALGVLNSHRKFFVPYFAPVVWNAAIIGWVVWAGLKTAPAQGFWMTRVLFAACWGGLIGGLLQFLVQLPYVAREIRGFRLSFSTRVQGVKEALHAFVPVLAGRGVVQLSAFLDIFLSSFLQAGAPSVLNYAQTPYMLPVSLFGLSVAAAELPELSRLNREGGGTEALRARVRRSLRQMAFLNVPTCVGYLVFGYLIIGLLLRTGSFREPDNWLVYFTLCGYTVGLLASTSSRLLQNTFYALGSPRTPARIAALRVCLSAALAVPLMFLLDRLSVTDLVQARGETLHLGAVGLAVASGIGSWAELLLLRRALAVSAPGAFFPWKEIGRLTLLALAACVPAVLVWRMLPPMHVALQALAVVGLYGAGYLILARLTGAEELGFWLGRFARRPR